MVAPICGAIVEFLAKSRYVPRVFSNTANKEESREIKSSHFPLKSYLAASGKKNKPTKELNWFISPPEKCWGWLNRFKTLPIFWASDGFVTTVNVLPKESVRKNFWETASFVAILLSIELSFILFSFSDSLWAAFDNTDKISWRQVRLTSPPKNIRCINGTIRSGTLATSATKAAFLITEKLSIANLLSRWIKTDASSIAYISTVGLPARRIICSIEDNVENTISNSSPFRKAFRHSPR